MPLLLGAQHHISLVLHLISVLLVDTGRNRHHSASYVAVGTPKGRPAQISLFIVKYQFECIFSIMYKNKYFH